MTTYLLDTNVWLRAVQPAAPQHALAVNALATVLARGDDIVITAQNLIEFWSVATRPVEANGLGWPVATAQLEIERVQALFPPTCYDGPRPTTNPTVRRHRSGGCCSAWAHRS